MQNATIVWNYDMNFCYSYMIRPWLGESSVIVIFYVVFFIQYSVIINYWLFWRNFFSN